MDRQATYDSETRIWRGKSEVSLYDFNCSVGLIAYEQMKNWPNKVIQINDCDGYTVTNKLALSWAVRIALHYQSLGLSHKHIVGIIGKNTTYVIAAVVACLMNATAFHTVNPIYDEDMVEHMFSITRPTVIFCDAAIYQKVYNATKHWVPIIYTLDERIDGIQMIIDLLDSTEKEEAYRPVGLVEGGNQTMAILCSSGTTGLPKAVCISNSKLLFKTPVTSEDVLFSRSGLDWLSGTWLLMLSITKGCNRIITNKSVDPELLAEIFHKYNVTATIAQPSIVSLILGNTELFSKKLNSLRVILCGGAPIRQETLERFQNLLHENTRIIHCYGMTEIGIAVMNTTGKYIASAGMLDDGISGCIVNNDGVKQSANETGELRIHLGKHKWQGYYNNAKSTAEIMSNDGWISTGDIAYFNDEGYLFIVDRKKDILKRNGFQYLPSEIEAAIAEISDVVEVCVVGVYDEKCGYIAGALVRVLPGSSLNESAVQAHVAQRFQPFKHLDAGVVFVDHLPQNHNNKVLRKESKDLFLKLTTTKLNGD